MSDTVEQYQSEDFASFVASERERLSNERRVLNEYIADYQLQLREVDREFAAIEAYEQAKTGKAPAATGTRQPRQRRRDVTDQVMTALRQSDGMRRARIIEALDVKGDRNGEMSVSNALNRLQKQGRISRREDGVWFVSEQGLQQAAE